MNEEKAHEIVDVHKVMTEALGVDLGELRPDYSDIIRHLNAQECFARLGSLQPRCSHCPRAIADAVGLLVKERDELLTKCEALKYQWGLDIKALECWMSLVSTLEKNVEHWRNATASAISVGEQIKEKIAALEGQEPVGYMTSGAHVFLHDASGFIRVEASPSKLFNVPVYLAAGATQQGEVK